MDTLNKYLESRRGIILSGNVTETQLYENYKRFAEERDGFALSYEAVRIKLRNEIWAIRLWWQEYQRFAIENFYDFQQSPPFYLLSEESTQDSQIFIIQFYLAYRYILCARDCVADDRVVRVNRDSHYTVGEVNKMETMLCHECREPCHIDSCTEVLVEGKYKELCWVCYEDWKHSQSFRNLRLWIQPSDDRTHEYR